MTERLKNFENNNKKLLEMKINDSDNENNSVNGNNEFLVKYRGKNYEISDFLKKHPGGSKILQPFKGLSLDDVLIQNPHSEAALHIFQEFVKENRDDYDSIERLIDWNSPILYQVGSLAENYWKWVNLPVNRSIRLFRSNFLESITVTPWFIVPIVWIPISLYYFYLGCLTNTSGHFIYFLPKIFIAFSCGILLWTFLEYSLHRKLFHMKPPSNSKFLITLHFILHGVHHKAPFDNQRLVFPPLPAAIIAFILFNLYKLLFPQLFMHFVLSGALTGYLCYDLMHYYLHHGSPKADTYLYDMKRYHNYHHFSHHDIGFGISTKLWDYIFETIIHLRRLAKSIEW
ncbi:fatty acid 2-hydroxylase [Leptopilina boulardi]|uniref:fatty acid 2-hydroxylase n=1 Tax=Leptopilina boulardi TaxID=63433 RepID=UPI0021F68CF4|nr:fatty acid 2-hydroxylase [Leptopilina boulardi]XP_051160542.1 fatty acid 2-hydroxylase [Leptopilina boulardi]XP_051160543.1 fatty acid 2-hydroxylase [Leptopilina boulardi]